MSELFEINRDDRGRFAKGRRVVAAESPRDEVTVQVTSKPETDLRTNLNALLDALDELADMFGDGMTAMHLGPHMGCGEAEIVRRVLVEAGHPEAGERLISGHAIEDEEGDDPVHLTIKAQEEAREEAEAANRQPQKCTEDGCTFRPDRSRLVDGKYRLFCGRHDPERPEIDPGYFTTPTGRQVAVDGNGDAVDRLSAPTKECDHDARPDDDPYGFRSESGDRCKDCAESITWIGPSHNDWLHVNDVRNR